MGERPGTHSPTAHRRNQPCRHLRFGLPSLQGWEDTFLLFKALSLWHLVTEAHGGMWHAPRNALRASLPVLVRSYKAGLPDHQAKAFALISLPLVAP